MSDPLLRRRPQAWARLLLALASVLLLLPVGALPAGALGENGSFGLPVRVTELSVASDAVTRIPLTSLFTPENARALDLSMARFLTPPSGDGPARATVAADGRTLTIMGEGSWTLIGEDLIFTPDLGGRPRTPVPLQIAADNGTFSEPFALGVKALESTTTRARASAGQQARVTLPVTVPDGGSLRLQLDGQSPGSTATADGRTLIIPEQGTWSAEISQPVLSYSPSSTTPGQQPDPVRFGVHDAQGMLVATGTAAVTVPIISGINRSAPYGQDIVLSVGEAQENIDPSTLRLAPPAGDEDVQLSADGTRAVVPGQGTWTLDREAVTVTFHPESADVHLAAPMMITGGDGHGAQAAPAMLSTAYPMLIDRTGVGRRGEPVTIDLSDGAIDVRPESVAFAELDAQKLPSGAHRGEDGLSLEVPGQGSWTIDHEQRRAVFVPAKGFTGKVTPVRITARAVYADTQVTATVSALFAPVLPVMRDDEARTAPDTPVTFDPLGNDTPGRGDQPLMPQSVTLQSLAATNLSELDQGRGKRLVMPGEGVFSVANDGAVTFTPIEGFIGRTSSIAYEVKDARGVPSTAYLQVEVDPAAAPSNSNGQGPTTGISTLLAGTLPAYPKTSLAFGTVVMLLIVSGAASLWIGRRMEIEEGQDL